MSHQKFHQNFALIAIANIIFRYNQKSTPKRSVSDMSSKYSTIGQGIETVSSSSTQSKDQLQNDHRKSKNSNRPKSGANRSPENSSQLKRDIFGSLISLNDPSNETN